jgi:hypothetical protein
MASARMSEIHDPPGTGDPPEAPELPRQIHLYRSQWLGLPVLFVLPVLALLGVFGEVRDEARVTSGGIELAIDYPTRLRSGQRSGVTVRVRNAAAETLDSVSLRWDTAYLHNFAGLELLPGRDGEPSEAVTLAAGEEWLVRLELEGGALWNHSGSVAALVRGSQAASVRIRTFVFP